MFDKLIATTSELRLATPGLVQYAHDAEPVLDLHENSTGWRFKAITELLTPNIIGFILLSNDNKVSRVYPAPNTNSYADLMRARTNVLAFAIDTPYSANYSANLVLTKCGLRHAPDIVNVVPKNQRGERYADANIVADYHDNQYSLTNFLTPSGGVVSARDRYGAGLIFRAYIGEFLTESSALKTALEHGGKTVVIDFELNDNAYWAQFDSPSLAWELADKYPNGLLAEPRDELLSAPAI